MGLDFQLSAKIEGQFVHPKDIEVTLQMLCSPRFEFDQVLLRIKGCLIRQAVIL